LCLWFISFLQLEIPWWLFFQYPPYSSPWGMGRMTDILIHLMESPELFCEVAVLQLNGNFKLAFTYKNGTSTLSLVSGSLRISHHLHKQLVWRKNSPKWIFKTIPVQDIQ
jgi:hypothetical protein